MVKAGICIWIRKSNDTSFHFLLHNSCLNYMCYSPLCRIKIVLDTVLPFVHCDFLSMESGILWTKRHYCCNLLFLRDCQKLPYHFIIISLKDWLLPLPKDLCRWMLQQYKMRGVGQGNVKNGRWRMYKVAVSDAIGFGANAAILLILGSWQVFCW